MRVLPQSWHVAGGMGICQRITCYAPTSSSGVMTGLSEAEERQQELNFLTRHQLMARGELEGGRSGGAGTNVCGFVFELEVNNLKTPPRPAQKSWRVGVAWGDSFSNVSAIISQLPLDGGASIVSMNAILVAKRFSENCAKSGKSIWKDEVQSEVPKAKP